MIYTQGSVSRYKKYITFFNHILFRIVQIDGYYIGFRSGIFIKTKSKTKGKRSLVTNFLKTSSLCK